MSTLELFANQRTDLVDKSAFYVYQKLNEAISSCVPGLSITPYTKGRGRQFAEQTTFGDLTDAVSLSDERRTIRTIHKAKGLEFENVAVVLKEAADIQRIAQKSDSDEAKRILYVALSRAKDRLFIVVPELQRRDENTLVSLGAIIRRLYIVKPSGTQGG